MAHAQASASGPSGPPVVRPIVNRPSINSILVNRKQEQNPLLELLRNVAWEYAAISPDFQVGASTCVLFLSLRYYRLHPEYLHRRLADLGSAYTLRVVLFLIDAPDPENEIKEITKICLINNVTIMCAWSMEEAAQCIMTYKAYENKPPDMIKERIDQDYDSILRSALTSIKGVNKTDVITMRTNFGDFATMSKATLEELQLCPGFGKVKARRVKDAFSKPFYPGRKDKRQAPINVKGKGKAVEEHDDLTAEMFSNEVSQTKKLAAGDEREYSPDWDIDLDLNPSDDDTSRPGQVESPSPQPPSTKKRRANPFAD